MFDLVLLVFIKRHLQSHASGRRALRVSPPRPGNREAIVLDWCGRCALDAPVTWNWYVGVTDAVDSHTVEELDIVDELESYNSALDHLVFAGVVDQKSWPGLPGRYTCLFATEPGRKKAPCSQWMAKVEGHVHGDFADIETCRRVVIEDQAGAGAA